MTNIGWDQSLYWHKLWTNLTQKTQETIKKGKRHIIQKNKEKRNIKKGTEQLKIKRKNKNKQSPEKEKEKIKESID